METLDQACEEIAYKIIDTFSFLLRNQQGEAELDAIERFSKLKAGAELDAIGATADAPEAEVPTGASQEQLPVLSGKVWFYSYLMRIWRYVIGTIAGSHCLV